MASNVAAKRYAKALFALCEEQNALEEVHQDLEGLIALMSTSPEWNDFVLEPFGALEKRDRVIADVLGPRTHALTSKFLAFVNRKRRIQILPAIYYAWLELYDLSKGILRAEAVSAQPLSDSQKDVLKRKLSKRFDKEVILTTQVDESMIGGLKVTIGDHVFDYSIESRLQQLRKEMLHA